MTAFAVFDENHGFRDYLLIDRQSRIFDMTWQFQDGSHDIIYAENCCHLLSEQETSGQCRFLISSAFVLVNEWFKSNNSNCLKFDQFN